MLQLMEREVDLIQRGREKGLEGARVRLNALFYQYTQTPEFNPEASKLQTVPVARSNIQPIKTKQRKAQSVA